MKFFFFSLFTFLTLFSGAQIPAYYSSIDFGLTGTALKNELSELITITHTSPSTYTEVWDLLKVGDLDPTNSANVLLIYGYNDMDGLVETDRTRDKDLNGGSVGDWNREHVFPKSLGSPDLGTSGPGSDPHNLRAADVNMNGNRSNKKFITGSGFAGNVSGNWYPGDEWKGDVARIIMYMYLRYGNRCLPSAVVVGTSNLSDGNMIDLLLDWNAEDDVSQLEKNRNNAFQTGIGNRNPFIDNPRIATRIWGGAMATDTWGNLSVENNLSSMALNVYPNPVVNSPIYVQHVSEIANNVYLYSTDGKLIYQSTTQVNSSLLEINTEELEKGMYILQLSNEKSSLTKKILIQ